MIVEQGRIVGFGQAPGTEVVTLPGAAVLPAFADAHLHLFPLIEGAVGVDCRPARTIADLLKLIRDAPGTGWVRATRYDLGADHPTRQDLDTVQRRPVRLLHRTGHLAVMNTAAFAAIPERVRVRGEAGGFVERDAAGEVTGRLWEPGAWLAGEVLPPLDDDEVSRGLAAVATRLFSLGITAVHDASPTNDAARLALWRRVVPPFRLLVLPGEGRLGPSDPTFPALGPTKLMLPDEADALPTVEELASRLVAADRPVAIHAVIHQAVRLAVEAILLAGARESRIEHAAEWPPDLFAPARAAGLRVVLHPGWVRERATRYLRQIDPEILPWLHRGESFRGAGIPFWFGSDAPASEPDPLGAVATAVTRHAVDGTLLGVDEALPLWAALHATTGGRAALDYQSIDGALRVGAAADFIVLDRDPFDIPAEEIATVRVLETYQNGERVWPER